MNELLYNSMSKERTVNILKELKKAWAGKSPSKYYFALGHAIKMIEAEKKVQYEKRRNEPIFWLDNRCPACGHSSPLIYKLDLLKGNIDCECQSKFNKHRINSPCIEKWSVAIDDVEAQHILDLLRLAERQDELYKEIARNCKLLGYK